MCRSFARVFQFHSDRHEKIFSLVNFEDVDREVAESIIREALETNISFLTEDKVVQILGSYGFPVLPARVAHTAGKAARSSADIGFPVVMKVLSDEIIHKSDVKGVVLNITNETEAENAYNSILHNVSGLKPGVKVLGVYITKMVHAGQEVILGIKRDPSFGPVIMFGLGGIFVELYKDVSFRVAPVNEKTASAMISEIKAHELLNGLRGMARFDIESIKKCIMRLSQLALDFPQINELDINPLIVQQEGDGCFVADAKILLI
jgi:acetyltransferase